MHILKIEKLTVSIQEKEILKDFNLTMKSGEIHAIMGPNGIGKSTLTKVIMGDSSYQVESGSITYDGMDLLQMKVDERARLGIFLAMQSPIDIDGVTNADFLKTALSSRDKDFKLLPFIRELEKTYDTMHMNKEMIHRFFNVGCSGGERKKNEIIQMSMLKPNVILLDEIDSGLDVDSLKLVGDFVMDYYKKQDAMILFITHYQRLLDYIKPDFVHIIKEGAIIKSGDMSLVTLIEEKGYDYFKKENINE